MKQSLVTVGALVLGLLAGYYFGYDVGYEKATKFAKDNAVSSYEECLLYAKDQAMIAIYPPQCSAGGNTFTQDIGNELEKADKIIVNWPRPGTLIASPMTVTGDARGDWYFEGSFPVELYDSDGKKIADAIAQTNEEWMTDDFVYFEAPLLFESPSTMTGYLLLKKDNPSGLPENDDFLRIPVAFP